MLCCSLDSPTVSHSAATGSGAAWFSLCVTPRSLRLGGELGGKLNTADRRERGVSRVWKLHHYPATQLLARRVYSHVYRGRKLAELGPKTGIQEVTARQCE